MQECTKAVNVNASMALNDLSGILIKASLSCTFTDFVCICQVLVLKSNNKLNPWIVFNKVDL